MCVCFIVPYIACVFFHIPRVKEGGGYFSPSFLLESFFPIGYYWYSSYYCLNVTVERSFNERWSIDLRLLVCQWALTGKLATLQRALRNRYLLRSGIWINWIISAALWCLVSLRLKITLMSLFFSHNYLDYLNCVLPAWVYLSISIGPSILVLVHHCGKWIKFK